MKKFFGIVLMSFLISEAAQASNLGCSEQKTLAAAPELVLFGFTLGRLPLDERLARDQTKTVIKGSCVFQVFYMYDFDPSVHLPGWYVPFSVHVDDKNSTVYQERLTDAGAAKIEVVLTGMNTFRDLLNRCQCRLP